MGAKAEVPTLVVTLLKNLIGGGIFSMPIGLYYGTPYPGMLILALNGALAASTYWMVGFCCISCNCLSFKDLWSKLLGSATSPIVDFVLFANGWFTLVTYLVLIGDFTTKSFEGLIGPDAVLATNRILNQWTITLVVLIPLSLIKDLSRLAFTSVLGLVILAYAIILVVGDSMVNAPAEWSHDVVLNEWRIGSFESIAIFSHAFVAHYNAPKIFSELANPTHTRWAQLVFTTYAIAFAVYATFAWCGFRRYQTDILGNVLSNFDPHVHVLVAWLGMGFCISFTYPIIFNAFRMGFMNIAERFLGFRKEVTESSFLTVGLVFVTAIVASFTKDVGILNALSGSMLGCTVAFVFPGLLFMQAAKQQLRLYTPGGASLLNAPTSKTPSLALKLSPLAGAVASVSGIAFAVIGTVVILNRASGGH